MGKINFLFSLIFLCAGCQFPNRPSPFDRFIDPQPNKTYDLLFSDAQIIDGSGAEPYRADLLIDDQKILFIGRVDTSKITIEKVVEVKGLTITPGFIDTHAHGDPLTHPNFSNFLAMGVTTICLGQDGSNLPLKLDDWMKAIEQQATGPNIALLIGHTYLRDRSGIQYKKFSTKSELEAEQKLLSVAFQKGVFGLSTGLEYTPGIFADDAELIPLAKIVGQNKGIIMSHVRSEDDDLLDQSIRELLRQGEHCNVHIAHLKSVYGKGKERAQEILNLITQKQHSTYRISADVYPYLASYTGIGIVFPDWAKAPNDYREVVKNRKTELLAFLKQKIKDRNGPEATLFGTPPYAGKTLAQVSEEQGLPYEKVLLGIGPSHVSGAYFIMDDSLQEAFIVHPEIMICSDGSPTMRHPRGYGTFAKIIEEYVGRRKKLTLSAAIYKMTGLPAKTLGLKERGLIKEGYFADLLVFDPSRIRANATYEEPHQLATGFEQVWVNGHLTWKNNTYQRPGKGLLLKSK